MTFKLFIFAVLIYYAGTIVTMNQQLLLLNLFIKGKLHLEYNQFFLEKLTCSFYLPPWMCELSHNIPIPIMMQAFINILVLGACLAFCEASKDSSRLLLVDRLRYDFFELEKEMWLFTNENALSDNLVQRQTDSPEIELIRKYEEFGDLIQKVSVNCHK